MKTELWERDDDDWMVWVTRRDNGTVGISHLPRLVVPPPDPLTYGYAVMALKAHGYGRTDDGPCCDACIIEGVTVVDPETFEAMLDPTPDPAPRLRAMVDVAAQRHGSNVAV